MPQDLTGFARKADIPDLAPYAQRIEIPDTKVLEEANRRFKADLEERDNTIADLRRRLKGEEDARSSEVNRLETLLTQHSALPVHFAPPEPPKPARTAKPDDLKEIKGVGPVLEKRLNAQGVYWFRQIAEWTDSEIDGIEPLLETIPDRVRREGWVEHARQLHETHHGEALPFRSLRAATD